MNNQELYHYGILGMKWGVRRYQNADGTRTSAGKKRYKTRVVKEWDDMSDFGYKMQRRQWQDDNGRWWTGGAANVKLTRQAKKGLTRAERKEWSDTLKSSLNDFSPANQSRCAKILDKYLQKTGLGQYRVSKSKKSDEKQSKADLRKTNEKRIMDEIYEYDKKVGGDFAKKFLENYDDIEVWDLYSPEDLKYWD